MQGRKSKEESEMTSDEQPMDPPSKLASRGVYSERKEERIDLTQQIANVQAQTFKLQRSLQKERHNNLNVTLTFLLVFALAYMYTSTSGQNDIKLIRESIQELQSRDLEWRKETMHLEKTIAAMQEQISSLQKYISRLEDELADIYLSELQKPQKSFRFLMKYSNRFPLELDSNSNFRRHYKQTKNKRHLIRKTTQQQIIAYSEQVIGEEDIQHFQIKIEETGLGMVAIGVFKESKNKTCGFCQSDKMYYIYAKNGKIYHGETLQYYKHSVDTPFSSITKGDLVTVFVNHQQKEIIWYVNSKYAGTKYFQPSDQAERLHPFILMSSRGDEIAITSNAPTSS